jgi:hypothetical protein
MLKRAFLVVLGAGVFVMFLSLCDSVFLASNAQDPKKDENVWKMADQAAKLTKPDKFEWQYEPESTWEKGDQKPDQYTVCKLFRWTVPVPNKAKGDRPAIYMFFSAYGEDLGFKTDDGGSIKVAELKNFAKYSFDRLTDKTTGAYKDCRDVKQTDKVAFTNIKKAYTFSFTGIHREGNSAAHIEMFFFKENKYVFQVVIVYEIGAEKKKDFQDEVKQVMNSITFFKK